MTDNCDLDGVNARIVALDRLVVGWRDDDLRSRAVLACELRDKFAQVNEFRAALADAQNHMIPRHEVVALFAGYQRVQDDVHNNVESVTTAMASLLSRADYEARHSLLQASVEMKIPRTEALSLVEQLQHSLNELRIEQQNALHAAEINRKEALAAAALTIQTGLDKAERTLQDALQQVRREQKEALDKAERNLQEGLVVAESRVNEKLAGQQRAADKVEQTISDKIDAITISLAPLQTGQAVVGTAEQYRLQSVAQRNWTIGLAVAVALSLTGLVASLVVVPHRADTPSTPTTVTVPVRP